jgi:hypothetical protein
MLAFTAAASIAAIARSVVPPFDVTCARNVAGSASLDCASAIDPANVDSASRRASAGAIPRSFAAASSASMK